MSLSPLVETLSARNMLAGDLIASPEPQHLPFGAQSTASVSRFESDSLYATDSHQVVDRETLRFEASKARRVSLDYSSRDGSETRADSGFLLEYDDQLINVRERFPGLFSSQFEISTVGVEAFSVIPYLDNGNIVFRPTAKPGVVVRATITIHDPLPSLAIRTINLEIDNRLSNGAHIEDSQSSMLDTRSSLNGEGESSGGGSPATLTLDVVDGDAEEEYAIYCGEVSPIGVISINAEDFDGGSVRIQLGGDAVYGLDYNLGSPPNPSLTEPDSNGIITVLYLEAGLTLFYVYAISDGIEPGSPGESASESVTFEFVDDGVMNLTLTGSAEVEIIDEIETITVSPMPATTSELGGPRGEFHAEGGGGQAICVPIQWEIQDVDPSSPDQGAIAQFGVDYSATDDNSLDLIEFDFISPTALWQSNERDAEYALLIYAFSDPLLEGTEHVKARAFAGGVVSEFATIDITEKYEDATIEKDEDTGCSCSCTVCSDGAPAPSQ